MSTTAHQADPFVGSISVFVLLSNLLSSSRFLPRRPPTSRFPWHALLTFLYFNWQESATRLALLLTFAAPEKWAIGFWPFCCFLSRSSAPRPYSFPDGSPLGQHRGTISSTRFLELFSMATVEPGQIPDFRHCHSRSAPRFLSPLRLHIFVAIIQSYISRLPRSTWAWLRPRALIELCR